MKITTVHALVVPLFALAVAGCRDDPDMHDLAKPADMAGVDLSSFPDLSGTTADMVTRPADMAGDMLGDMRGSTIDMTPPPGDLLPPPGDLSLPSDLPIPPGDLPIPPGDLPIPPGDLPIPPGDLPMPTDDMGPLVDMASTVDMTSTDPSEFIALRVGDGTAALTSAAAAAFLERHKISDGSLVGTPIALPTTVIGTNRRFTLGGITSTEGALNRSTNGRYLSFGGYDAAVGTANVSSSVATTVNRVIGRLDAAGTVDTSTAGSFFSTGSLRSVISTDGSALWATSSLGLAYTTFGATAATVLMAGNLRWAQILFGQLFVSSGASVYHGINQVGTGTPTTPPTTATLLSGFLAEPMTSHYGFIGLDRDGTAGVDVLYIADDRDSATGGGIQRWTLSGTTWKLDGTIKQGLTAGGARGLTGFVSGTKVVLLATTSEVPTRLVSYIDDGTALDMLPSRALATAPTNTAYRGIALPPQ